jgi:hypothetical protein
MTKTKTLQLKVRLPPDLHRQLVRAAASHKPARSLNSEIVMRLYDSMATSTPTKEQIARTRAKLEELPSEARERLIANVFNFFRALEKPEGEK